MHWNCPESADFINVNAMNAAYLALLRRQPAAARGDHIAERLSRLGRRQREQLAATPLLLASIGERDARKWHALLDEQTGDDLFATRAPAAAELMFLGVAIAGFAWQLARRDTHTLRLLYCASHSWCELIAEARYLDVVDVIRRHPDLVEPREKDNAAFWNKLLGAALSAEREVRRAARLSALQFLFTSPRTDSAGNRWPAAASASRKPKLRVAEQSTLRPIRRKPR